MSTVKTVSLNNLVYPKDLVSTLIVAPPTPLAVSPTSKEPDGKTKVKYFNGSQLKPQPLGVQNLLSYYPNTTLQIFYWYTEGDYSGDSYEVNLTEFLADPNSKNIKKSSPLSDETKYNHFRFL